MLKQGQFRPFFAVYNEKDCPLIDLYTQIEQSLELQECRLLK